MHYMIQMFYNIAEAGILKYAYSTMTPHKICLNIMLIIYIKITGLWPQQ